jgi:hypothetical protein
MPQAANRLTGSAQLLKTIAAGSLTLTMLKPSFVFPIHDTVWHSRRPQLLYPLTHRHQHPALLMQSLKTDPHPRHHHRFQNMSIIHLLP